MKKDIAADKKTATKPVEKTTEMKEKVAEEIKAPAAEKKASATKASAVKPKETAEKPKAAKPAAKKKTTKAAPKKELQPEVFVQYHFEEVNTKDIVDQVKAIYVADGHRASSIKSLKVYIKPEDHAAYYVINEKITGKIFI